MQLTAGLLVLALASAHGKERHYEQVRTLLIVRAARCTDCHLTKSGAELNAYGARIAERPEGMAWADRILQLEADPPQDSTATTGKDDSRPAHKTPNADVDGDGVANWIEILAKTNPGTKKDTPDRTRVEEIEAAISCKMCHKATNLPGIGLDANPHNELGEILSKTLDPKGPRKPDSGEAVRAAAEAIPILKRLSMIKAKRPPKSPATYWQRIRMLRSTCDPGDAPPLEMVKKFRKGIAAQKRAKGKDASVGFDHPRHRVDGFLREAKGLD